MKDDGKKHSLNISKCRPKDQGEVTCSYGDHKTKATLAVKGGFLLRRLKGLSVFLKYMYKFFVHHFIQDIKSEASLPM